MGSQRRETWGGNPAFIDLSQRSDACKKTNRFSFVIDNSCYSEALTRLSQAMQCNCGTLKSPNKILIAQD